MVRRHRAVFQTMMQIIVGVSTYPFHKPNTQKPNPSSIADLAGFSGHSSRHSPAVAWGV